MEIGVPPLAHHRRSLRPELLDGRRGVQEDQPLHRLFVVQSEPEGNPHADVVGDYGHLFVPQQAGQLVNVRRDGAGVIAAGGLVRIPEPPHVGNNHLEAFGQDGNLLPPAVPEFGPAVEQNCRRSFTLNDVVDVDAVDRRGPVVHIDCHYAASFHPLSRCSRSYARVAPGGAGGRSNSSSQLPSGSCI